MGLNNEVEYASSQRIYCLSSYKIHSKYIWKRV